MMATNFNKDNIYSVPIFLLSSKNNLFQFVQAFKPYSNYSRPFIIRYTDRELDVEGGQTEV